MWIKQETDYSLYLVTDRKLTGARDFLYRLQEAMAGGRTGS